MWHGLIWNTFCTLFSCIHMVVSYFPPGHTAKTINWSSICLVLYFQLPTWVYKVVVLYLCAKYSTIDSSATRNSSTGLIVLSCLFLTFFQTTLYWYKSYRFWKPWIWQDQSCTNLANPSSRSGDTPQTVLRCTFEQTFTSAQLQPTLKVSVHRLFEEYLQTYLTDLQDKYMAGLV